MTEQDPHSAPDLSQPTQSATSSDKSCATGAKKTRSWKEQRRLAQIFGEVLPEEPREAGADVAEDERQYRENIPPHHGQK